MITITRRHHIGNGTIPVGTAENADDLLELLRDAFPGVYTITGSRRAVRVELQAPVGDDRAFVEDLVRASDG